jgi:ABC-type multidrug transport system fused ATPase/permease subunit
MLGQLEGTLIGIRVVKAFGAERFERRRYSKIMRQLVAEQLRMSRIDAFSAPVLETITLLVAGCVVLYAAYLVLIARTLSADIFIMVMVSLMTIGESLRRCSKVNNALQKSNAAAARIFEVLDIPTETRRASGLADRAALLESEGPAASESTTRSATAKSAHPASTGSATGAVASGRFSGASASSMTTQSAVLSASSIAAPTSNGLPPSAATVLINLPSLQREIRFENITFSYPNTQQPALCGVSLAVTKGQSIAIVGGNGSGKTTLMALLPRFYDPGEGRVCIDGVDLATVTLRSLRRQISLVTQDSVIFPGTIAENIAYGDKLATPEAIEAAAKRAFAHEFILEKPQGYATPLGEMGGQLSGGQKQRICIARAILKQAPILILDEATSQVDAQSEHLIQRAIESVMHERTTFVIAHRFSTITRADSIVVMERGKIVGQGKHEELLRTCETYQKLYERQLFAA